MPKTALVLSAAAMAIILCAGYAAAGREEGGDPSCSRPLPPGSPAYAATQEREAAQAGRDGYASVCGVDLARYDLSSRIRPMSDALARLAFTPVSLAGTPFATLKIVGGVEERVSDVPTILYRVFKDRNGTTVTLSEHDMSADGSQTARAPGDEQQRVNGLPARLAIVRSGVHAVSTLSWREGRRDYDLWMDGDVTRDGRRTRLFDLAASLPKSVPAKTGEDLAPLRIGPDGMPIVPPAPLPMTLRVDAQGHLIKQP